MLTTKWQLPVRTHPVNGLIETSMFPVSQDTKKSLYYILIGLAGHSDWKMIVLLKIIVCSTSEKKV